MKMPNKVITYNESVLSKFPIVLSVLEKGSCAVISLFNAVKNHLDDVLDFLDILDCLFALNKIKFDEDTGGLSYVARNTLR